MAGCELPVEGYRAGLGEIVASASRDDAELSVCVRLHNAIDGFVHAAISTGNNYPASAGANERTYLRFQVTDRPALKKTEGNACRIKNFADPRHATPGSAAPGRRVEE